MPLLVSSEPYTETVDSIEGFLSKYPKLKTEAEKLKSVTPRDVPSAGLLYINQREYAVVSQHEGNIRIIGSDDATTCHIVIIRHSGTSKQMTALQYTSTSQTHDSITVCMTSFVRQAQPGVQKDHLVYKTNGPLHKGWSYKAGTGVTGLAHCDGCDTERGLQRMIHLINTLSESTSSGRMEVTLVGGFNDDRKESEKLSLEIIGILQSCSEDLHLVSACITCNNNVVRSGKNFPHIYGIAVDLKAGNIFPATFMDKGPEIDVRSACHFGGFRDLVNIYDNKEHHLVIGPYTWQPMKHVDLWLEAPDHVIRKYLSTSPDQEPPYFENHVRASLKVLFHHSDPCRTLFADGKAHRYKMNANGIWVKVTDAS